MSWFCRRTVASPSRKPTPAGSSSGRFSRRRAAVVIVLLMSGLVYFGATHVWLWWLIRSGHRAIAGGQSKQGLDYLTRAVAHAPNSAEANYRLAVALRRSGQLDRVEIPLKTAQKLGWPKEDIERQCLLLIAQNGDIQSVDARLKSIMTRGATDEEAEEIYEALVIGYLKTYRLKDAWDCLAYWGEWQPRAIFPKFWRADIYRRQNRLEQEEREYREILAINPSHTPARCRLAEMCKASNRVSEAVRDYEKCLAAVDVSPEAFIGLAECYRRLGQIEAAEPLLQRVTAMSLSNRQRAEVLSQLGQIAADAGNWKQAIQYFEESVELSPYEVATLFALSQAYTTVGETAKSQTQFERSQHVQTQLRQIDKVMSQIAESPMDAGLRYEAGKIMMDLGMKDEGAAWLQVALQVHPNYEPASKALEAYYSSRKQSP